MAKEIPGKNYYLIRHKLIFQSLCLKVVAEKLRQFYKIPQGGIKLRKEDFDTVYKAMAEWIWKGYSTRTQSGFKLYFNKGWSKRQAYLMAADRTRRREFALIHEIADRLLIDRHTLEDFILFNIVPKQEGDKVLHIVWNYDSPIDEPGIYLKLTPTISNTELTELNDSIELFKKNFYKIIFKKWVRKKSLGSNEESAFYIDVETRMLQYYLENKHAENQLRKGYKFGRGQEKPASQATVEKTYKETKKFLRNALGDIASEKMTDLEQDLSDTEWRKFFDPKLRGLQTKYDRIVSRYNLPKIKDLTKILQLIPNNP